MKDKDTHLLEEAYTKIYEKSSWDKFDDLVGIASWDDVVEAGEGDPTSEESRAIEQLGYYGQPIDKESIEGLKRGIPYQEKLAVRYHGVDGTDKTVFNSIEEMRNFVKDHLGSDARNITQTGFGTDYANWSLEGATMEDLGIKVNSDDTPEKTFDNE